MKKIISIVLGGTFLSVLVILGFLTFVTPDRERSVVENRVMAQQPDLNIASLFSGSYFDDYNKYFNDQFFGRDYWVKNYTKMQLDLNKTIINGTVIGKDGWLMQGAPGIQATNVLDESVSELNDLGGWGTENNIPVYLALAPHKINMLSSKYPRFVRESRGYINRDYLVNNLDSNVNYIDLVDYFQSNFTDKELEGMFFKTDHHWNGEGAQVALSVITGIFKNGLNMEIFDGDYYTQCNKSSRFMGTYNQKIYGLIDSEDEFKCRYIPKDQKQLISFEAINYIRDQRERDIEKVFGVGIDNEGSQLTYSGIFSADWSEIKFEYHNLNQINLLILKDSYANPIVPNLAQYFSKTFVLDLRHYKEKNVYQYIVDNEINAVLIIYNDTNLSGDMYKFKNEEG